MYGSLLKGVPPVDVPGTRVQRDSYFICDRNGDILYTSSGVLDLLSDAGKLPRNLDDFLAGSGRVGATNAHQDWQSGGHFTVTIPRPDQADVEVGIQVTPLPSEAPTYHVRLRPSNFQELPGTPVQLKDSELMDALSAQIAVLDREGNIRAVNQAWSKFARSNGAPEGQSYLGFNYVDTCRKATGSSSEEAARAADGLEEVLSGKRKQFELEYPCHSPEERRWFIMRANAIPGEEGGAVVTHISITSQKLMQRLLSGMNRDLDNRIKQRTEELEMELSRRRLAEVEAGAGREKVETLFSTVPDYVWSFRVHNDGRSTMELQSPAVERITGYPPQFFATDPLKWMEIVHEEDRPDLEAGLQAIIDGLDQGLDVDFRIHHRDGRLRWLNSHFVPMHRDTTGCRVAGVTSDITDRRRLEDDLKAKSEFITRAAASLPGLLFTKKLKEDTFTYVSQAHPGFAPEENAADITIFGSRIHPDDMFEVEKSRRALPELRPGELNETIYRVRLRSGAWIWLRSRCTVFEPVEDAPREILGYIEDVTRERENAQATEAARDEAQGAMVARDRFLANISHEIRTPIFAILGVTDIMQKENPGPEAERYLKIIKGSGDTLLQLLNDIIDFSRLERGAINLEKINVQIADELDQLVEPYRYRATEKGLGFEFEMEQNVPETVQLDPLRTKQIITNLLSNAVKFTDSGMIRVHVRADHSDSMPARDGKQSLVLEIIVSDSGIGVDADKQEAVFEVFRQSDESINRRFGGSGLGLSIVKELVRLMHGDLELRSPSEIIRTGQPGSDFIVRIPVIGSQGIAQSGGKKEAGELWFKQPLRVLLAEDNAINRMLVERFLGDMNCEIVSVENGLEAVRKLDKDRNFDLILMDVNMPSMNGYDATRQLRNSGILIPIIGITADVFKEDVNRCLEAGMNDHMGKPIWPEELFEKITGLLGDVADQ